MNTWGLQKNGLEISNSCEFAEVVAIETAMVMNLLVLSLFQTLVVTTNVGEFVDLSRTITYHDYEIGTSRNRIFSIWTLRLRLIEKLHSKMGDLIFSHHTLISDIY